MNTSSTTIKDLNARRIDAVKRRLAGESLAKISQSVDLSVPTVVAAIKAFEKNGWGGVPVKKRGRPTRGKALSTAQIDSLRLHWMEQSIVADKALSEANLLTIDRLHNWLCGQELTVSAATTQRYARNWGLAPASPAQRLGSKPGGEVKRYIDQARHNKRRLVWVSAHTLQLNNEPVTLLCAHTARGLCLSVLVQQLHSHTLSEFLSAVTTHLGTALAPVMQLSPALEKSWILPWQTSTGLKALILPPGMESNTLERTLKSTASTMTALKDIKDNDSNLLLAPERLTHLQRLEAESIHIMREVVAEAENPVMMYSVGKDSAVMLHLAVKAFYPAPPPFPLLHVDTTWKFKAMYEFRDSIAKELGFELLVHQNEEGIRQGVSPFTHGSELHTDIMKTQALKQALDKYGFDVAFGGARRDEEKSRAKERVFSFRTSAHRWEPKSQRPELWNLYNAKKRQGESIRVFPISNWTELDIWQYIHQQSIPIVPLYFSGERPVVERDGQLIMVDDDRMPLRDGETPEMKRVRFRTLGCYPLTGAVESNATTLTDIIQEMLLATTSERQGRLIDHDTSASMEKKKQEGYF